MTPKLFRVDVTKCEAEIEIKTILRFRQVSVILRYQSQLKAICYLYCLDYFG